MPTETFTLVARETEPGDGIDVDVVDADGLVEATSKVAYAEYDVAVDRDGDAPEPVRSEFSANAGGITLDHRREDHRFEFRALGDDGELACATVRDEEWALREEA